MLDLSYPDKPSGGWNNQTNVGAYVWDVINPNPNRWPSGIKLFAHLLVYSLKNSRQILLIFCREMIDKSRSDALHMIWCGLHNRLPTLICHYRPGAALILCAGHPFYPTGFLHNFHTMRESRF